MTSENMTITIKVTDHDGAQHELAALPGWRVMAIIRDWDLPIKAKCGGACATCHVYVDPEWLAPAGEDRREIDQLEILGDLRANSRLACHVLMSEELNGLTVTLAPGSAP